MYILGIGSGLKLGHHDGAASLIKDGQIIAASEEERFTRAKHARGDLPLYAIRYCLLEAKIGIREVDIVASPLASYTNYDRRLEDYFKFHFGYSPKIELADHHLCHAASAYYLSGFKDAMMICLDFSGDSSSGLLAIAEGKTIKEIKRFHRHNSAGVFYGMLTQFLGFQMTNDEYKVMGLASYGKPVYEKEFEKILIVNEDGYQLNPVMDKRLKDKELYTTDFSTRQEQMFSDEMVKILGRPRLKDEPMSQHYMDIAASGQKQLEKAGLKLLEIVSKHTKSRNLCLAGGITLNCTMNSVLYNSGMADNIFIQPAAGDAGVSLGAACYIAAKDFYPMPKMEHAYLGPSYTNQQIEEILKRLKLHAEYYENIEEVAAKDIAAGKIVGWFQGRMEFGPRALGSRSILADPRDPYMKDRINSLIKFREEFRPFAPSVLEEYKDEYFLNCCVSPFMTMIFRAKPDKKDLIPAVVHVDGTCRVQTVSKKTNPRYWTLIKKFQDLTGVPVILNTSLNVNTEPIVESPSQAISTFAGCGMDVMIFGNYYLSKSMFNKQDWRSVWSGSLEEKSL